MSSKGKQYFIYIVRQDNKPDAIGIGVVRFLLVNNVWAISTVYLNHKEPFNMNSKYGEPWDRTFATCKEAKVWFKKVLTI